MSSIMKLDYKIIKGCIIRSSTRTSKATNAFEVDLKSLNEELSQYNVQALPVGTTAHRVGTEDIYAISEYFVADKLSWFSKNKFITTLIFTDAGEEMDDGLKELVEKLYASEVDDPELDKTNIVANILAKYPCYMAMVVSYQSNDPTKINRNSYFINCRANKVIIRDPNYQYNPKDMA